MAKLIYDKEHGRLQVHDADGNLLFNLWGEFVISEDEIKNHWLIYNSDKDVLVATAWYCEYAEQEIIGG